jgi:hypothetical protein
MTIQVSVMNGYGLAMASDRHVFRGGNTFSTGQEIKLRPLRGTVPAAMMASGPFAVFGVPVSRLALRLERTLADSAARGASTPDALAEAVLRALETPLEGPAVADDDILAEVAEQVLGRAMAGGGTEAGLTRFLDELAQAPRCRGAADSAGRALNVEMLTARLAGRPGVELLRRAPELCGRAVAESLGRDWRGEGELFLTVGAVCPATGVPLLIALRMWRGIGNRLHFVSRLANDWTSAWTAGRTVLVAQGSGRALVEAMVDGLSEDHWDRMESGCRDTLRGELGKRWDTALDRLGISSPDELGSIATGLVRGAEVVGFLTRDGEGTVAGVDGVVLTPMGVSPCQLGPVRAAA